MREGWGGWGGVPATSSVAASRDASVLLFEALARLGGNASLRSAWGGAAAFGGRPRFARRGLASLGPAELRKWLSSAGTYVSVCSANPGATYKPYLQLLKKILAVKLVRNPFGTFLFVTNGLDSQYL